MAGKALIIGGGGQVGRITAPALAARGWEVTIVRRSQAEVAEGVRVITCDRNSEEFEAILASGFDVVIDLLAFRLEHHQQLTRHHEAIKSIVMMSSAAVYQDKLGRTLQTAVDLETCPVFDEPIGEDGSTVEADDETYAGRKRSIEIALLESSIPTTVIRPTAIHGPFSPQPREWFYVRRILDGRRHFVLGFEGRSSLHPASVFNLAEMICLAAEKPGDRILNCGDPDLPDEREIASSIAAAMGQSITQILLPGSPPVASPWSLPVPFFLSCDGAVKELGYTAKVSYRSASAATCNWITEKHRKGLFEASLDARFGPPGLGSQVFVGQGHGPFDYSAEDLAIADLLKDRGGQRQRHA